MNKTTPTLKDRVWRLSVGTFLLTMLLVFTSFTLYSMKKSKLAEEHVVTELTSNLNNQINQFLPSFLLPEQKLGIQILLERIKKSEGLEDIQIISGANELHQSFSNCDVSQSDVSTCISQDQTLTAVIAPLKESEELYGYLLKVKKNVSPDYLKEVLQVAFLMLFVLSIAFGAVYILISRLLSKTLPTALDNLVSWIEADLNGKKGHSIDLPFKELEDLKSKISEVMDKYNSARDQAIIGQLTSGIMHDIKTPLQSMVSAMHLVDEQSPDSPKRLSRLENAHLMSKMNLPVICNIIETTLDGNRSIKVTRSESNVIKTVEESMLLNAEMAALRSVSLIKDYPETALLAHDSTQFIRVMNNLVKNAIEAASENQNQKAVRVSILNESAHFKFVVEDSGSGINGDPEKIFRAFRTSKVRGTGLELLITKKIVEAHGGSINVSASEKLGGAQFLVTIPKDHREAII